MFLFRYPGESHFSILKVALDKFGYVIPGDAKAFIIDLLYINIDGLGDGMMQDKCFQEFFQFLRSICKGFKLEELLVSFKVRINTLFM